MYLFPDKNIIYSQSKGSAYLGYFITYFIIFKDSIFSLYFNEESKKNNSETGQINTFVK